MVLAPHSNFSRFTMKSDGVALQVKLLQLGTIIYFLSPCSTAVNG